jgi:hypothetical protein
LDFDHLSTINLRIAEEACSSSLTQCHEAQADVVFLVDTSKNIKADSTQWNKVNSYIVNLLQPLAIGHTNFQVGVVISSNNKASAKFDLKASANSVDNVKNKANTINGIKEINIDDPEGDLKDTLLKQFNGGKRKDVHRIIVTITDCGAEKLELIKTLNEVQKEKNTDLYVVGISNECPEDTVKQLAGNGGKDQSYFIFDDFEALDGSQTSIFTDVACATIAHNLIVEPTLYCVDTAESGNQCYCYFSDCDVKSVNSTRCSNVNECTETNNNAGCSHGCVDTQGSYYCYCFTGYVSYDRHTCTDQNECTGGDNPCGGGQTCINSPGGYYCISQNVIYQGNVGLLSGNDDIETASTTPIRQVGSPAIAVGSSTSTIALSTGLAAIVGAMVAVIVILTIRYSKKRRAVGVEIECAERSNIEDVTENESSTDSMHEISLKDNFTMY